MAQRAARSETTPPEDEPFSGRLEDLGPDWFVARECRLRAPGDRGAPPALLIHPARGVAVLDLSPSATPGAVEAVRARLDAARFPAIFSGHLPVVHLHVPPRRMPLLPDLLDEAFAAEPPLRLPAGDAWAGVAARALTAEQPAPRIEPQRFRGGQRRRWVSVVRTAAALALCLLALGGVVAVVTGGGGTPAPVPAGPVAAVVGPAAVDRAAGPSEAAPPPAVSSPVAEPVPAAPPSAPPPSQAPIEAASPPPPPAAERVVTAPPLPPSAVEIPPPPPPQRAAPTPPPRRQDAATPPPARSPPERAVPRRQQEASGAWPPAADAPAAAPPPPEAGAQRCRRITALIGLGASPDDDDIRFFNEACIRW